MPPFLDVSLAGGAGESRNSGFFGCVRRAPDREVKQQADTGQVLRSFSGETWKLGPYTYDNLQKNESLGPSPSNQ